MRNEWTIRVEISSANRTRGPGKVRLEDEKSDTRDE